MKKITIICDICKTDRYKIVKTGPFMIISEVEDTEGHSVDPFLNMVSIDICGECESQIIASGKYVRELSVDNYTIQK